MASTRYVTWTIKKATPTITPPTARTDLVYNGTEQTLVNAGSVSGGTMEYNFYPGGSGWSTNVPTAVNASGYSVQYRVVGGTNYEDIAPQYVTPQSQIIQADPQLTLTPNTLTLEQGETATINVTRLGSGTISASVASGAENISISVSGGTITVTASETYSGDASILVACADSGNYSASSVTSNVTVNGPGEVTLPSQLGTLSYTGSSQVPQWSGYDPGELTISGQTSGTNAGTYTASFTPNSGYVWQDTGDRSTRSVTWTIQKATPNYTAPSAIPSLAYTGSAQALITAGTTNGGTMEYRLGTAGSWGTSIPSGTDAGSYTIYWRITGDSNYYDVSGSSFSVTIAKADYSYSAPTAKSGLTYSGSAQTLADVGSTDWGTMEYSLTNPSSTWSTTMPQGTNAGSYTVYWRIVGDANHMGHSGSVQCSIAKIPYTVYTSVNSLNINVGDTQTFTATADNGGTIYVTSSATATATVSKSGDTVTVNGVGAGSATVRVYTNGDSNHTGYSKNVSVSVVSQTIAAVPTQSGTLTYNGNAQSPSWSGYDSSKLTLSVTAQTNAGTYSATFTPKTGYSWWDGTRTAKTASWTIGKAAQVITLSTIVVSLDVGDTETVTATWYGDGVLSVQSDDSSIATASSSGGTITIGGIATGNAVITASVSEGTNYLSGSATASVEVIISQSVVYYGTAPNLSTSRAYGAATTVGNYALTMGGNNSSSYYNAVEAYDSSLTKSTPYFQLSSQKTWLAATTVGNYALAMGGRETSPSYSSSVNAYDQTLMRSIPESLSSARTGLAATTVGNYALAIGGYNASRSNVVDAYDTSLTRSTPTGLSVARTGIAATTVGNYALAMGGNGSSNTDAVDAYNTSLTRSTPTALSTARAYGAATTAGNYALAMGGSGTGYQTVSGRSKVVDAYNTSLTRTTPEELSVARSNLAATTISGFAIVVGGQLGSGAASNVVDAYNSSLTRSTPTPIGKSLDGMFATCIGNYALFAGGTYSDFSNTVYVYTVS